MKYATLVYQSYTNRIGGNPGVFIFEGKPGNLEKLLIDRSSIGEKIAGVTLRLLKIKAMEEHFANQEIQHLGERRQYRALVDECGQFMERYGDDSDLTPPEPLSLSKVSQQDILYAYEGKDINLIARLLSYVATSAVEHANRASSKKD